MLSTTTTTTRPSSSDLSFFSPSKVSNAVASSSSSVVVKTRKITAYRPTPSFRAHNTFIKPSPSSTASPNLTPPLSPRKRKSSPLSAAPLPREVKRLRATASGSDRPRKRAHNPSSKHTSRGSSPEGDLPPSPQPIYRSSRSRSSSLYPALDSEAPIPKRAWLTDADGEPDSWHLSSEMVVKRLMRSYKACK